MKRCELDYRYSDNLHHKYSFNSNTAIELVEFGLLLASFCTQNECILDNPSICRIG
jgi:hypothetical protein